MIPSLLNLYICTQCFVPLSPFIHCLTTTNQSISCKPMRGAINTAQPTHYEKLCSLLKKTLIPNIKSASVHSDMLCTLRMICLFYAILWSINNCRILYAQGRKCTVCGCVRGVFHIAFRSYLWCSFVSYFLTELAP